MGNQLPAIQSFSSPPPLPALIRQNNKVLLSKQMLVLCSPSVQGGHRELSRHLLLLWHLGVTHRWHRDLEREDRVSCRDTPSAEPEHTGPTALLQPPAPLAVVSAGLGKRRNRNQGPPNSQNSSFRKSWSTGLLQQRCLDCVHQKRAAHAQAEPFPTME